MSCNISRLGSAAVRTRMHSKRCSLCAFGAPCTRGPCSMRAAVRFAPFPSPRAISGTENFKETILKRFIANGGVAPSGSSAARRPVQQSHASTASGQKCLHGLVAVERTVRKPGPNTGRQFAVCPRPRSEQCGFFVWLDSGAHARGKATAPLAASTTANARAHRKGGISAGQSLFGTKSSPIVSEYIFKSATVPKVSTAQQQAEERTSSRKEESTRESVRGERPAAVAPSRTDAASNALDPCPPELATLSLAELRIKYRAIHGMLAGGVSERLPDGGARLRGRLKGLETAIAWKLLREKRQCAVATPAQGEQGANSRAQSQPGGIGPPATRTADTQPADDLSGLLDALKLTSDTRTLSAEDKAEKISGVVRRARGSLSATLKPHQEEALAWMVERESGSPRGGILADGMGLGKTVSVLALVCHDAATRPSQFDGPKPDANTRGAQSLERQDRTPTSATVTDDANKATAASTDEDCVAGLDGALSALSLAPRARSDRGATGNQHCQPGGPTRHETTHSTDLSEASVTHKQSTFTSSQVRATLTADVESNSTDANAVDETAGTLVVCPLALLRQWESEISRHCPRIGAPSLYHGASRSVREARRATIVLTTYATLAREHSQWSARRDTVQGALSAAQRKSDSIAKKAPDGVSEESDAGKGPASEHSGTLQRAARAVRCLFDIRWRRVVLDEAHNIRNAETQSAAAVRALRAERRWALTGTPLHNAVEDVESLLRFLSCAPSEVEEAAKRRAARAILAAVMLRRTKEVLALPPRRVHVVRIPLPQAHRKAYEALMRGAADELRRAFARGSMAHVLKRLTALRIACNQPALVEGAPRASQDTPAVLTVDERPLRKIAVVESSRSSDANAKHDEARGAQAPAEKRDPLPDSALGSEQGASRAREEAPCKKLHQTTLRFENVVKHDKCDSCACGERVDVRGGPMWCQRSSRFAPCASEPRAAKFAALAMLLDEIDAAGRKAVIFSQWTGTLDCAEKLLLARNTCFCRLDGSMTGMKQADAAAAFQRDSSIRCILVSLMAGGVGLNLTAGSVVIMLDLWFNPQMEEQAYDRVHRIGQDRPVDVYRLVTVGTVEERILEMQARKRRLARAVVDGATEAPAAMTLADLREICGM